MGCQAVTGLSKLTCCRVFGEDISDQWTLPPIETYIARAMRNDDLRVARQKEVVVWPIDYADPEDEFYGYVHGEVYSLDGYRGRGTKEFIKNLYGMLIPLVSEKTNSYVASKSAAFRLYQEHFDDEWAPFLREVWETCRIKWEYRLPKAEAERSRLRINLIPFVGLVFDGFLGHAY
jgi:hypothetical protein